LEWSWIIAFLLSIGLAVVWADSLLAKRRYDVLSLINSLNVLVADGRATFFSDVNLPRVIRSRVFHIGGAALQEHRYFDWTIRALGVYYCFVIGDVSFPASPGMGSHTIHYAEFTIPGLSYNWHRESQLKEARWFLELSLLIPPVIFLVVAGLCWRRLRTCRGDISVKATV
jgi:hypothetical protein